MQLLRWNPMRGIFGRQNRLNWIFDDFFFPFNGADEEVSVQSREPVVDIYDNDDNIVIKAELPGVDKKDIVIDVKGRVLTLKGERSAESEVQKENYYCKERSSGQFWRTFTLPESVDPEKIKADYKEGVLKIDIPKPEAQKTRQITVH